MDMIRDLQPMRGSSAARPTRRRWRFVAVWLVAILPAGTQAAETVDYLRQVKPILKERCYACHGALQQKAKPAARHRRAHASRGATRAGRRARRRRREPADRARRPRTTRSCGCRPEGPPLTDGQIALAPGLDRPGGDGRRPTRRPEATRDSTGRSATRSARRARGRATPAWVREPDRRLPRRRTRSGTVSRRSRRPPSRRLLRRVYLDLIGLPPTREELHAFLADPSADAYEKVVDRLLASPQYGERWGRHWMDVWRYSDWYGRRAVPDVLQQLRRMIWRWRDWIVRSLNDDKGYDRMVQEMLAADEIAPADDARRSSATGFLVRNWYTLNHNQWMRDNVEHTGKAFLGLTFNCAHCHDHKYDPISQEEYFRFRAFFEPLELRQDRVRRRARPRPVPEIRLRPRTARSRRAWSGVFDEKLDAQTFIYTRRRARNVVAGQAARPARRARRSWRGRSLRIEPVDLPPEAWYPG